MPEAPLAVPAFELRDYLGVLRRRKWVVILATVVVVITSLVISLRQEKVYEASAKVLLQAREGEEVDKALVDTQIQILESDAVRDIAAKELAEAASESVSGSQESESRIIVVSAASTEPELAPKLVTTYVKAFIEFRRSQDIENATNAARELRVKVDELQPQIDALNEELRARSAALRGNPDIEAATREQAALQERIEPRRNGLISQQLSLEERLREAQVEGALSTGGAQTVTPATTPTSPVRPDPVNDGLKALGAGLLLGVALAFLFEYLDDSIKTKEDLEQVTGSELPVLGLIPLIPQWDNRRRVEVASLLSSRSPAGEAYRSLRTSVQYKGLKEPLTSLLVTSPGVKEGKSTTVANLAVVLAHAGARVVMVDCDLRRPQLHGFFALSNEVGFTSVMIGDSSLPAALQQVSGVERLHLLSSGPVPANPSELLASERLGDVLASLQADGSVVLIDSPPLLAVTDASVLAGSVDATLLVVSAGISTKKQVQRGIELLRHVDTTLFGTVLNRAPVEGPLTYSYQTEPVDAIPLALVEGRDPNGSEAVTKPLGIGQ